MTHSLVALLTDFGTKDAYVAVMKGVMKTVCRNAEFIDITHDIPPQDVRAAAFTLLMSYRYFPQGTVFLVVVDPGVGLRRKPIAVATEQYTFIAPDNGVLSYTLLDEPARLAVELRPAPLGKMSNTFHGRDIFSPAAAHAANGEPLYRLGDVLTDALNLYPKPALHAEDSEIAGEVLFIDHFGNIITSIGEFTWQGEDTLYLEPRFNPDLIPVTFSVESSVTIADQTLSQIRRTYGEAERGQLLALVGSSHFLEISVNQGSAAERLGVQPGDPVTLKISREQR